MYHGSELVDAAAYARADAACALTRRQHASAWNDVMATILKEWRQVKIRFRQSMRIYLKNNLAKFHPQSNLKIWSQSLERGSPQQEQEEQDE